MLEETFPVRLYVEGQTEFDFFMPLLEREGFKEKIFVRPYGGTNHNLKRNHLLPLRATTAYVSKNLKVVGIITDADAFPDRAFQSVQDAVRTSGLSYPSEPLILSDPDTNGVRTAIMVLPSSQNSGAIEDVFLQAFSGYGALDCLEQYEGLFKDCLDEKGVGLRESRTTKAKFQMLLAAVGGELTLKEAIKKRDWFPWDSGAFDDIKQFLTMLADTVS